MAPRPTGRGHHSTRSTLLPPLHRGLQMSPAWSLPAAIHTAERDPVSLNDEFRRAMATEQTEKSPQSTTLFEVLVRRMNVMLT